jgi:hypothetical protein
VGRQRVVVGEVRVADAEDRPPLEELETLLPRDDAPARRFLADRHVGEPARPEGERGAAEDGREQEAAEEPPAAAEDVPEHGEEADERPARVREVEGVDKDAEDGGVSDAAAQLDPGPRELEDGERGEGENREPEIVGVLEDADPPNSAVEHRLAGDIVAPVVLENAVRREKHRHDEEQHVGPFHFLEARNEIDDHEEEKEHGEKGVERHAGALEVEMLELAQDDDDEEREHEGALPEIERDDPALAEGVVEDEHAEHEGGEHEHDRLCAQRLDELLRAQVDHREVQEEPPERLEEHDGEEDPAGKEREPRLHRHEKRERGEQGEDGNRGENQLLIAHFGGSVLQEAVSAKALFLVSSLQYTSRRIARPAAGRGRERQA